MTNIADVTLLRLSPIGIPPYSARGISQTLEPIDAAASMRRTVNGTLVDISASQFRLYKSSISCTDQDHPALDGIWPGQILTVDCICELSYADTTDGSPSRPLADTSAERTDEGYVFFRPQLTMMVTGYKVDNDEWGHDIGWTLDLEEVAPENVTA
jgi:hypothetical protein